LREGVLDRGVAQRGERFAGGPPGGDRGEALRGVPAVLLQVQGDHRLNAGTLVGVEVAAGGEVLGQGAGLVAGPGLEGGDELALVDQADLQRQQAEEEVAIGGDGGHGAVLPEARRAVGVRPQTPGPPQGCTGTVGLSHAGSAHAAPHGRSNLPRVRRPRRSACRRVRLSAQIAHTSKDAHRRAAILVGLLSRGSTRIRRTESSLLFRPMCGWGGTESKLARVGPTTPKSLDPRLLRDDRTDAGNGNTGLNVPGEARRIGASWIAPAIPHLFNSFQRNV
jgi:hypothetical protein